MTPLEIIPPIVSIASSKQQQDQTVSQITKQQSIFRNDSKFATIRREKRGSNVVNKQQAREQSKIVENARDSSGTSTTSNSDSDTNT